MHMHEHAGIIDKLEGTDTKSTDEGYICGFLLCIHVASYIKKRHVTVGHEIEKASNSMRE